MENNIIKPFTSRFILILLAAIFSCFTLWLIDSWIKYPLFFFQVALILILDHSLTGKTIKIKFGTKGKAIIKFDYIFLATSTTLLVLNEFKIDIVPTMFCAIIVSFFLPGYILLRLLRFQALNSWIEWLTLSFVLSLGLTSIIFTAMLPFAANGRAVLLSAIYVGISLLPLLKDRIRKTDEKLQTSQRNFAKEYDLADVLILLWITFFFVFAISILYPQMSLRPGLDIWRHFSSSRLLALAPDAYSSIYPWFHTNWANVYELSSPTMEVFQTGLAYLSVMIIFSFYVMAKAYLSNVDKRAPILATVFFSVFAGFGWIHFLREKISSFEQSTQLKMLSVSSDASYMDVGYGQGSWLWLWFRPMTASFAMIFILIYLLTRKDTPKIRYIAIFSFITITLGLIHIPELMLFNALLLILTLFKFPASYLRLKEATIATLIGSIAYFVYAVASSQLGGIVKAPTIDTLLILAGTAATSCIFARKFSLQGTNPSSINHGLKVFKVLILITALTFIAGFTTWYASENLFSTRYVSETYYIPLIMYPVLLGIVGFLSLHGIIVILQKYRNHPIVLCIPLFFFMIIFGKFISIININFIDLGYGEKRFWPVMFATASMLASVSFIEQLSELIQRKKKVYAAIIIAFIVMLGVASTNLSIEYWNTPASISRYSLEAVEYLSSPANREIRTPILTASTVTRSIAECIPSPYIINTYRYPIWESMRPETPLMLLYNQYYLPPYVYLEQRDFDFILSHYGNSFFTRYMFRLLPEAYKNNEVTALKIPEGSPPSLDSDVALVIPDDNMTDYFSAYVILSLGDYDYTVCLISDVKTIIGKETIIVPRDNEEYFNLIDRLALQVNSQPGNKEIIILNSNGYGPLAELFFESQDENIRAHTVECSNFTLNLPKKVDAPVLTGKGGVDLFAWYSDGKERTPFAARLVENGKSLVYVNVYPIIKAGVEEEIITDARQVLNLLMSEVTNGRVKDISIYGNDGATFDTKVTESPFGFALSFDGIKSYIEIPNSDELNVAEKITIEAWIKPENPDSGFTVVSKKVSYSSKDGYVFLFDGSSFYFNFGNGSSYFPNAFPYGRLKANQWYQLVMTYDKCHVRYYINGKEVGSIEQSAIIAPNNLNLIIGKRHDNAWKLKGSIYKIAIYSDALSASEIFESYNRTISKILAKNPVSSILGSLLEATGLDLPHHVNYEKWVFEGNTAFFKNASSNGEIIIKSSSFTGFTINNLSNITITTDDKQSVIDGVKELYINETRGIEIRTSRVEVHPGKGFYAKFVLVNPTISLDSKNTVITLVATDGEVWNITTKNGEVQLAGELTVYARTPTIKINGKVSFENFYSLFSLYRSIICSGQDLTINGSVEFQITISDTYTFISNMKWSGLATRTPPRLQWNELDSIRNMIPWLIISIILAIFWRVFLERKMEVLT